MVICWCISWLLYERFQCMDSVNRIQLCLSFRFTCVDLQNKPISQPTTNFHDDIVTSTRSSLYCSFNFFLLFHDAQNRLSVMAWDSISSIFFSSTLVRRMVEIRMWASTGHIIPSFQPYLRWIPGRILPGNIILKTNVGVGILMQQYCGLDLAH